MRWTSAASKEPLVVVLLISKWRDGKLVFMARQSSALAGDGVVYTGDDDVTDSAEDDLFALAPPAADDSCHRSAEACERSDV